MGAKQSKRSVDISGKEAESAGEVAASIAGGEGRVEPLADADALKPQINGDAHIHDTDEKQKDIDSGTPENEKDATTEKETKQQQEEDKEVAQLTNGESEQKVENGESTTTLEDGKKPKKEKVKKKWSLRSISFSRKDKPKQEKKTKDDEPKTNGETEKVPEETADVASEVPIDSVTAEVNAPTEIKEDKTPETPVTEPITNGSSTPDSPKADSPAEIKEPAAPCPVIERPESKTEVEPDKLPVNGLSIEEPTKVTTETVKNEDSKEETTAETTETVPEISVIKEVCVEQMPLIDTTPPPLPANPPPSSVASFAATTMAPELSNASLANTADNANLPTPSPPSDLIVKDKVDDITSKPEANYTVAETVNNELSSPVKKVGEVTSHFVTNKNGVENDTKESVILTTIPIECKTLSTLDNVITENEVIEKLFVEKEKVSPTAKTLCSPPEIDEAEESKFINDSVVEPEEATELQPMPAPALELIEQSIRENLGVSQGQLTQETDLSVPTPPPELIENIEIEEAAIDFVTTVEETSIEKRVDHSEHSTKSDTPLSPRVFVDPILADENNSIEKLPDPPTPIDDEDIHSVSVPDKTEIIPNINKDVAKSINICDTEEMYDKQAEYERDDSTLDQNSVIKSTNSQLTVNLIETAECNGNGNIETAEVLSEISVKEIVEVIPQTVSKDIVKLESDKTVTSPEKWTPAPPSETNSAAGDEGDAGDMGDASDKDELPLPPPPAEPGAPAAPSLTPQESLPVSDKLADLMSEVPEVPELKTDTETTSGDAGVAN